MNKSRRTNATAAAAVTTVAVLLSSSGEARRSRRPPTSSRARRNAAATTTATAKTKTTHRPTVFACGTDLRHAIANLSDEPTLCPSGSGGECPRDQYCYAGLPSDHDTRQRQSRRETEMVQRMIHRREDAFRREGSEEEAEERFLCGTSWEDAVDSACEGSSAASSSSDSTSLSFVPGPIRCPSGMSSQCPPHMECYASVSCRDRGVHSTKRASDDDGYKSPKHHHSPQITVMVMDYQPAQNNLSSHVSSEPAPWKSLLWDAASRHEGMAADYTTTAGLENYLSFGSC